MRNKTSREHFGFVWAQHHRKSASRSGALGAVLIIDGDSSSRRIAEDALKPAGYHVGTASTGHEGIAVARTNMFDMVIVELRLPDMSGTAVVRALRAEKSHLRFALSGSAFTIRSAVEAMKLGAADVIEKPLAKNALLAAVGAALAGVRNVAGSAQRTQLAPHATTSTTVHVPPTRPRSAAERWAMYVLKGCESNGDLKTLEDWASYVGVSYSTLCESCRLVGIRPLDARDLMRLLRAVMKAPGDCCHPATLLDVSDRRTMKSLLDRAALADGAHPISVPPEQFIYTQKFVAGDTEALGVLQVLLAESLRAAVPRPTSALTSRRAPTSRFANV